MKKQTTKTQRQKLMTSKRVIRKQIKALNARLRQHNQAVRRLMPKDQYEPWQRGAMMLARF